MPRVALAIAAVLLAGPEHAAAFTCTLSPDKSTVIVKTSNPNAQAQSCTVTCRFVVPDGIATVSCTQTVPAGAKDWYVCIRPTGGKPYGNLDGGEEKCAQPGKK